MVTFLDSIRQPEYTGANRCWPCTITNVGIAGVLTVGASIVGTPLLGAAVFGVSLAAIWLRGYLVPGTPELTKRYFPDRVLAWFDKGPERAGPDGFAVPEATAGSARADNGANAATGTDSAETEAEAAEEHPEPAEELEPEAVLVQAGVIEPCDDVDDLCLSASFREEWEAELERVSPEGAEKEALADVLDADGEVAFEEFGDAFAATVDGEFVGQWESRAALVADLAAARVLPDHVSGWDRYDAPGQGTLVRSLRVFVETCPSCGGAVVPSQKTVSSCCREYDVMAVSCEECGERLLETPAA